MNSLSLAVFLVAVAAANAGLLAGRLGLGLGAPIDSAAVVTGPSGQIVRSGLAVAHAAPLAVAHAAPLAVAHAAPYAVAHGAIAAPLGLARSHLAYAVPAGSGLEGQWIPDINEKLYDDGSYKPHIYGF
ncbi:larval cuticle protein F1-like [Tenebrio molitor]|uniref:larval cuticle protein F1-like n=1 Tax=Tenebrio molitor TaxID=7067 RepID=UPI0036249A93